MRSFTLGLIIPLVVLFACKRTDTVRPNCEAPYIDVAQDTSFLSTPLVIPTQLIEDKLNRAVGWDALNKEKVENAVKLKISRLENIQVQWKDNVARFQVPLRVLIEREIVRAKVLPASKALGVKLEFSLEVVFETAVDVGEDWKIQPKTKFVSFKWLSEVKTLGGLIDLKKMAERRIHRQMPEVLENLDSTIRATVHLDRVIGRVWRNIQKPIPINRKDKQVWLKINPIRFEMGTITTEAGNLMIQGRLSATTETLVGASPEYAIDSVLPPLVKRRSLPNDAYVYMLSEIPYADINAIIAPQLAGKVFEISGHRIKVATAEVWGCGANLILHLKIRGAFRGDVYFQGIPRYEADSQRIDILNFDFEVKTQEVLLSSADWLLHSTFKEQMRTAISMPLAERILKIPESIMQGIEQGRAGKKMEFTIEHWDFRPQQIWVRPTDIAMLIIVNARARVELEKI